MWYYYGSYGMLFLCMFISLWAQIKVKTTFSKYDKIYSLKGHTGFSAARQILDQNGLSHVRLEVISGHLTDHYDPRANVIRLSESVANSYSVAAIAGTMRGGAVIDGVTVYANVRGDGKTSGISSYIRSGNVTVLNTSVYGSVTGNPAAGFFALSNDGSSNVTIRNSFNYANITAQNSSAGGFYTVVASVDGSRTGNLTITGSANFGAVSATDWRCGGIVGEIHENKASTMTIDYGYNMGAITMKGSGGFAAGIAGGEDVYNTIIAGADATGSSSGVAKAADRAAMVDEMIAAVRKAWDERHN